ncbi:MAG: hypothetical protein AAGB04_31600, partial [Pseudomonadota bacterium]
MGDAVSDEADLEYCLDVLTDLDSIAMPEAVGDADTASEDEATKEINEKARKWTLARSNQGMGLGEKLTEGKYTGVMAVKVYVDKKKPLSKIKHPVPKRLNMPNLG